jgi:hypothetical protein
MELRQTFLTISKSSLKSLHVIEQGEQPFGCPQEEGKEHIRKSAYHAVLNLIVFVTDLDNRIDNNSAAGHVHLNH